MTPSTLEIASGDFTTIPEETAWGAFQTLKEARSNPALAADPLLATSRDALRSYVTQRRANGHDLFPNVTAAANRKRTDFLTALYTKPLSEALPAENFAEIERRAAFTPDPEGFQQRQVNRSFLSATLGKDIPAEQYDAIRTIYAKQHLGLEKDTSDKAVFSAIQGRFKEEQAGTDMLRSLSQSAFSGTFKPDAKIPATLTKEQLQAFPERLRENVSAQYSQSVREARRTKRRVMPIVERLAASMIKDGEEKATMEIGADFRDLITTVPTDPKDRQLTLALLAERLKETATDKAYSDRFFNSIGRGFIDAGAAAVNMPLMAGARLRSQVDGTEEEFAKAEQEYLIGSELRRIYNSEADPLASASDGYITGGLVLAANSLWTIPLVFAGPAGIAAMGASFAGSEFEQARAENPEANAGAQFAAAAVSGTVQAGIETVLTKTGIKLMGGKLPGLTGILNKAGLGTASRTIVGGGARAAGVLATEYTEEALQGATGQLAQDLALEFSNIAPQTDWKQFWGDWLTVGGQEQQQTLQAILPFAIVGSGGGSIAHFRYGRDLAHNASVLHAIGIPAERIKAITSQTDPLKIDEEIKAAFSEGLEARTAEQKKEVLTILREAAAAREAAGVPTVTSETNSFTDETTHTYTDPLTREQVSFDTEEEALLHWREQAMLTEEADLETIRTAALDSTIESLTSEGKASEDTRVTEEEYVATLPALVKRGLATQEQIDSRIRLYILQNGLTPEQAVREVESLTVKARSFTKQLHDGQLLYNIQLFKGADPLDAFEDFSEDSLKRAIDAGVVSPTTVLENLRTYQRETGDTLLETGYEYDPDNALPLIEAFSKLARAHVIGSANTAALPGQARDWLNLHTSIAAASAGKADQINTDIRRAGDLRKQLAQGNIPESLLSLLSDSIGINETETLHRLEQKHREQLAAEAMEGFPEIREEAAGLLPHPETLRKKSHPLAGEAQRIYDALKKPTRRKDKQGRTIDRTNEANAYFLPVGEMEDLDLIRRRMNEKGFDFENPAQLLEALDSSIAYSRPVYATSSRGNDSFAMGWNPEAYQRVMPRDLFNEGKVLSMNQKIVEDYNNGKLPEGFEIYLNEESLQVGLSEDGDLFSSALEVSYNGTPITLTVPYNSGKGTRFPLIATAEEIDVWGATVYDENGNLDSEFIEAFEGDPAPPSSPVELDGTWQESKTFLNQLGVIGLWHVDSWLSPDFEFELSDDTAGFDIRNNNGTITAENLAATMDGEEVTFFMDSTGSLQFEYQDNTGNVIDGARNMSPEFRKLFAHPEAAASFSLGNTTVTPTASTTTYPTKDGGLVGPASFAISAYHGTPHKVDKFTTAKMGTGEGAQAFGWGLYFAESRAVAGSYVASNSEFVINAMGDGWAIRNRLDGDVENFFQKREDAVAYLQEISPGNLYTVTLKAEPEELLDWDKPVSQQSEKVKSALKAAGFYTETTPYGAEAQGQYIYHQEDTDLRGKTFRLAAIGIKGIRFLDGNSRNSQGWKITPPTETVSGKWMVKSSDYNSKGLQFETEEEAKAALAEKIAGQTYNYVIFNDADIEITEENGTPVSLKTETSPLTNSFSLSPQGINRLEAAIAHKLTAEPAERAAFYERVRNRIAALTQRIEDMENGVGIFARKATDEVGEERRRIQDAIAEAKAIVSALPIEARGRVTIDFEDITSKGTEKGRVKALLRLIAQADDALEVVLKDQYLQAFEKLLDLAAPDLRQNKSLRGRLTPETQRLINAILPLIHLTPTEASAASISAQASYDALESQYPDPTDTEALEAWEIALARKQEEIDLLDSFASLATHSAAEIASAHRHLLTIYTRGRTARTIIDQQKRQETASMRRELIDSVGGVPSQSKWAKRTENKTLADLLKSLRVGLSSFHEVMEEIFPQSPTARLFQDRLRESERGFARARIDARERFEDFARSAFNLTGRSTRRKMNRIIADLSTRRDDWNIEIAEGHRSEPVKMSEEQAAAILDGTLKPGWESDLIAMESLRQALADFRLQRLTAQNQAKAFSKTVIRFNRTVSRGAPTFLRMSDMEAVYYLQLAAQEQYLPALDRYGFTAKVLESIREKIDPRALTFNTHLRREYDDQYKRLNPVYQRLFGMDMPQIRNYTPGKFESLDTRADDISPDGSGGPVNAMSAGFTKTRSHHTARPKQSNALANYWQSLESTEYFIAYAETMRDMRQVFRSPDVRRTIEGNHGTRTANDFSRWLDILETDGQTRAAQAQALQEITQNTLASQSAIGLAFNLGTVFKQFSAGIGHFMLMPTGAAIRATYKAITDPASLRMVWNSESVQQRILQGMNPEDKRLLDAAQASPSMAMELLDLGRLPISWADAAFTTITGAAAYKYQYDKAIENGLPDATAHTAALAHMDRVIVKTAQPATTQDKSLAENTATGFAKALFLFRSDPRQKFSLSLNAIAQAKSGEITKTEAARRVFFSWGIYGLMGQLAGDIWKTISRDDDDEDKWNPRDYAAAMLAGPLSGVPLLGQGIDYAIRSTVGTGGWSNSANPIDKAVASIIASKGSAVIRDMGTGDLTIQDFLRDASNFAQIIGTVNPAAAIAPALIRAGRDIYGTGSNIKDIIFGESETEAVRRIISEEKKAATKETTARTGDMDALADRLASLPPDAREKRLKALDKETRARVLPRIRKASMTPEERSLSTMSLASRKAAIDRILTTLPENRRQPFLDRLESLGINLPD